MKWTMIVTVVAVMCAILFFLCFAMTREHVKVEKKEGSGSSINNDLKALVTNAPWWRLLGAAIGQLLCSSIRGGAAAYYFANILGANIFLTCAVYLTIGEISQMLGVAFAVPFSERIGKRNTFIFAMVAVVIFSCLIWFIPAGTTGVWWLIILQVLVSLAFGLSAPLTWSMFADVADYSELKHGNNSTGLIFSSSSMAQKFGGAFGGFILLMILGAVGFMIGAGGTALGLRSRYRGFQSGGHGRWFRADRTEGRKRHLMMARECVSFMAYPHSGIPL